jgi:flagellar biosynthetic protein FliO
MEAMRELAAAALVLGLLGVLIWRVRRGGFGGMLAAANSRARRIQSVERLALGAQHSLHLVRVGEQAMLVAAYPSGCSLIASVPWREIEPAAEAVR